MTSSNRIFSFFVVAVFLAILLCWMAGAQSEPDLTIIKGPNTTISDMPAVTDDTSAGIVAEATGTTIDVLAAAALSESSVDQEGSLLAILHAPGRLNDRIRRAISLAGTDNAVIRDFLYSAAVTCDSGLLDSLAANPLSADHTRQWAIGALVDACEGFDAREFQVALKPADVDTTPDDVLRKFGKEPAREAALDVIRRRDDFLSLADAGRVLDHVDGFPPSLRASMTDLGIDDRSIAWSVAASLYQCSRSNGDICGSGALTTLTHCASVGCRENSDLRSAFSQSLSPRQWAAAQAYLRWIQNLKRSGS